MAIFLFYSRVVHPVDIIQIFVGNQNVDIPELKNYDNKITTPATYIPILEIENELEGNSKKFELGGAIENQYEGRTAKDIWESWNQEQKIHFFIDHKEHPYYNMGREEFVVSKNDREKYVGMSYDDLPKTVKLMISDHVEEGQYANGGMMADGGFVVVSENDGYWYIMSKPTSKQDAEEFLNTLTIPRGEVGKVVSVEDAKNHKKVIGRKYLKMADGGDVSEMKIGQTTVRKGFNGWVGKTMVDNFKGYDWDITTIKNSRGDLTTTAQGGKSEDKGGYKMFTFMLFQDPSVRLQTSRPARVNEKVVSEQHAEALKVFKEKVGNTPDKEKMASQLLKPCRCS